MLAFYTFKHQLVAVFLLKRVPDDDDVGLIKIDFIVLLKS